MHASSQPMRRFGFILHPIEPKKDVGRKYPALGRLLSPSQIDFFSAFFPPVYLSRVTGVRSEATGVEIEGLFVACPYTPKRMMQLPAERVYRKIIQSARVAERQGAQIIGLGAYTSVVGDAGQTISRHIEPAVTTGDSYTVAVAVEALLSAGRWMGVEPVSATAAVLGATGTIGSASAELLADEVDCLVLVGRDPHRLNNLADRLRGHRAEIRTATRLDWLRKADLVLAASNAPRPLIDSQHLASGAVVCDIARPRDVAREVALQRKDVLVIDGGLVDVPGEVDYGFDFGFPPGTTYACMAETMALALEGRFERFSLGKVLQVERIREINAIAHRHGFRLGGFRSFDRPLSEEDLARARARAMEARPRKRGTR